MATIVCDCPRCNSNRMTFDILAQQYRFSRYDWQNFYETYCVCRACLKGSVFIIGANDFALQDAFTKRGIVEHDGDITSLFDNEGYVSLKDMTTAEPPEFLSPELDKAFREGTTCFAVQAFNGAGTMFRLCLDLVTKPLLPAEDENLINGPNARQRRDLGLRIAWLLDNDRLPESFRELAQCVREDANDGAHVGSLSKADAEDLQDFTFALLERLVTEPERLKKARERRTVRRAPIA